MLLENTTVQNEDNFHHRIANLVDINCATPEHAMKLNNDVVSIFQDMAYTILLRGMQQRAKPVYGKTWWKGAKNETKIIMVRRYMQD